jgi:hypothetical protein
MIQQILAGAISTAAINRPGGGSPQYRSPISITSPSPMPVTHPAKPRRAIPLKRRFTSISAMSNP